MKSFYDPTAEQITKLAQPWTASFSGGKDSTSLVTYVEWLRRAEWIDVAKPRLVQADTGVEYPELQAIAAAMREALTACGWECAVVNPLVKERLYVRILGIGVTPVHAGIRNMRWCTRSTKIDPMERFTRQGFALTGLRMGESDIRDGKIKKHGCAAGGECGLPELSERTYSPILQWKTCQVVDWLNGHVAKAVTKLMGDVLPITRRLLAIYDVKKGPVGFDWHEQEITAARFGCIGCPAISAERYPSLSVIRRHGENDPLNELYDVWFEAREFKNRCWKTAEVYAAKSRGKLLPGPIRMEVRKVLFARVMDIQRRAGVVLITPEDEAFIKRCWADKVYPRGWSEADELTEQPGLALFLEG